MGKWGKQGGKIRNAWKLSKNLLVLTVGFKAEAYPLQIL
jgi:hypothetical protein